MPDNSGNKKALKVLSLIAAGLIVVGLIFAVVFMGKGKTAGRAIFTGAEADTFAGDAGFSGTIDTILAQNEFDFVVGARLGTDSSVAYSFRLRYPSAVLEVVSVVTPQDATWQMDGQEFRRVTDVGGVLTFEHATLNVPAALEGDIGNLATVRFRVRGGQSPLTEDQILANVLFFEDITILSLDNGANIVQTIKQPAGEIGAQCDACEGLQALFNGAVSNDKVVLCNTLTDIEKGRICPAGGAGAFTVDINGDLNVNGQDAFIILKIAESGIRSECGGNGAAPCPSGQLYVCDDGSFRVNGYHNYAHDAAALCPYADMAGYVRG